jgi:alkanesulfonate monooxygenase
MPRIQVAFRPIIAPTEELAWEKAYRTVDRINARTSGGRQPLSRRHSLTEPENTGSQRLLEIAQRGEKFDRALWTPTAKATGGAGTATRWSVRRRRSRRRSSTTSASAWTSSPAKRDAAKVGA